MVISQAKVRSRILGIRTDQVWLLGVLICFALIVSLMPVFPNDFWWHLKIGKFIYETGMVPQTSMYSWSISPDTPFFYGAWLAEYLFYLIYLVGKIPLIIFVRTLLTVAAFALIGTEAVRRSGSWRIAGVVIMLAAAMGSNNVVVRPQIFAWIPFVIYVILLNRYVDHQLNWKWLMLLPAAMAFWVNVHGSFIVGLVLVGIFFVGEAVRWKLKHDGALSLPQIVWLGATGLLSGLATLINPRFTGIFWYIVNMMTDKSSQELVGEWQSPTPDDYVGIIFYVSVLVIILIFAYSKYRPTLTEILSLLAFLFLAFTGIRYVVWFGLIAMPIVGKAIREIVKDKPWMAVPRPNLINVIFLAVLTIPFLLVQPWWIDKLPLPNAYWKFVRRGVEIGPMLSTHTPVEAASYLRQHQGGKLFNEMGYGSYLIWAVPEQPVFADPRVELYPYELWMDYLKVVNGIRPLELLDKYGADRVMLAVDEQQELITALENDPAWKLHYEDQYTQIWEKGPQ